MSMISPLISSSLYKLVNLMIKLAVPVVVTLASPVFVIVIVTVSPFTKVALPSSSTENSICLYLNMKKKKNS